MHDHDVARARAITSRVRVDETGRFLVHEDGTPFFYLADTAWELFHVLRRDEAERYLETRAQQRFTVIQAVALSEFDGLRQPNAYGHRPFQAAADGGYDPRLPDTRPGSDDDYWDHVDYIVEAARARGLYVGLLPTWGDKVLQLWGEGPEIFGPFYRGQSRAEAAEKAYAYGRFLGERYRSQPNIIWILGGDRPADGREPVWRAMARGIAAGVGGDEDHRGLTMTYHPYAPQASSALLHHEPWLSFNMVQSGHHAYNVANYELITNDYHKRPYKPTLDGEARYEDHPVNWDPGNGRFDDFDVRQAAYWAVLAGAAGHTYGHYSVFQFHGPSSPPTRFGNARAYWDEALHASGAGDMAHLRALVESRPFLTREPDQSLIAAGQDRGMAHVRAARGRDGAYAFVYIPTGKPVTIDLSVISGDLVTAWWYDPREGTAAPLGAFARSERPTFTPPSSGRGQDWVLALDDAAREFPAPGQASPSSE